MSWKKTVIQRWEQKDPPLTAISAVLPIYLCFYFKTLEFLLVVNSGVICCVVKMDSFPITAEPGKINLVSCIHYVKTFIQRSKTFVFLSHLGNKIIHYY